MEILMCVILPIAVVLMNYASKKFEQRRQAQIHDAAIQKAAMEIMETIKKSLPSG